MVNQHKRYLYVRIPSAPARLTRTIRRNMTNNGPLMLVIGIMAGICISAMCTFIAIHF